MGLSCNRTGTATLLGALTLAGLSLPCTYVLPVLGNEISPDQTLGDESSTLRQVSDRRTQVEGGAIRGRHLFHSFSDFSIRELQEVYFANPSGIEAILGRITGDRPSSILGTLGVDGEASLFLLNPNGFVFGENAVLDIRGSFVASTSDRFEFANGLDFSATHPNAAPLLTVDVPVGVQLGESALGDIDSLAQLSTGQDLTLDGRDIAVQGGLAAGGDVTVQATQTLQVRDQVSQPFLASAGGQLELQGNAQLDISALSHPESYILAGDTLTLRSSAPVIGDGRFQSGDSFRVATLEDQPGDLRSPNDPVIRSAGDVTLN
ncbi:MAG: filamentous hemagglutinin N-terminal domain-containing protein, partial [Leptolyngbyaceae bacterium]|nr:filamentous hemagglutinin N-terminal domain-containing protein [Leptolyngbyaceae bacterium]